MWRQVKRENSSLPLIVLVSKTRVLKLPITPRWRGSPLRCQCNVLSTKLWSHTVECRQKPIRVETCVTAPCVLGNKLLNIQFAKYHIWNNKSEGFPNMVLSTETFNQSVRAECSEAVNARYTFQQVQVNLLGSFVPALQIFIFISVILRVFLGNTWAQLIELFSTYCPDRWRIISLSRL